MCRGIEGCTHTNSKKRFNCNLNESKQISINLHRINSHNLIFVCPNFVLVVVFRLFLAMIPIQFNIAFASHWKQLSLCSLTFFLSAVFFSATFKIEINKSNETMKRYPNTLHFQLNEHIFTSYFVSPLRMDLNSALVVFCKFNLYAGG